MVKFLWCALVPFVANAQNECIGGSFQLTVDDSVSADDWVNSMKATVIDLAGGGVDADAVDVKVSYEGPPAAADCAARHAAIAAAAPAAASPTPASPTPASPTPASPTPASPTPASPTPASPTPASPTPASPTPASPTPASPTPASPTPASPTPASPSPAPTSSSGPSSPAASSGPSRLLFAEDDDDLFEDAHLRRLADATADVAYTVVASADAIAAAHTALAAVDETALAAAVATAVAADPAVSANAPTVVAGSLMAPTEPAGPPAPSPSGGEDGDDSAACNPSLSLLGVAVAAGSFIV